MDAAQLTPNVLAMEHISLHVSIWIAPSNVPKFLEMWDPVFKAVTSEPNCLYFEMFQDPDDPGHFTWVENWDATVEWLGTVSTSRVWRIGLL